MRPHPSRCNRPAARGVSLVEAIVAMAVMAFGMMAVVGLQATLRLNSDVAKQRSEAVRIAEETIEQWRAFNAMASAAGQRAYDDIASLADETVAGYTTNTSYTLSRTVSPAYGDGVKALRVAVSWVDRNGQAQRVELDSIVARVDPALSGALALPPAGTPERQPLGRHVAVPAAAVNIGGDSSAFRPPGAPAATVWVFSNGSGLITSICSYAGDDLSQLVVGDGCVQQPSWFISGFVRFSFGPHPDPQNPAGLQLDLSLVALAAGDAFADGECHAAAVQNPRLTSTSYVCRVPQSADTTWTGSVYIRPPLVTDGRPAYVWYLYDVCRYANGQPGNVNHPRAYSGLSSSLGDQNFLVVSQGVSCPAGTQPHQPVPS